MTDKRDLTEQLTQEHWRVFVDQLEWYVVHTHCWSSLELMVNSCRGYIEKELAKLDLVVATYYLNTDNNQLHFYSKSKPIDPGEVQVPGWWV